MKKIIFIIMLFSVNFIFSQTLYNTKLLAKFDKDYLEKQLVENPHFIKRQNYIVENSYKIVDAIDINQNIELKELITYNNKSKVSVKRTINNEDLEDFNILNYKTEPGKKEDNYYKIGNTGKVLIVYSAQKQAKLYNEYMKNN